MRELETRLAEAESFVALRPKLQAKLQQQQTELIATRRELADSQQLAALADGRVVDAQEQLKMAMLDKEMAEERAELAEAELEEVKEKLAVVEVELQVVREGGGMLHGPVLRWLACAQPHLQVTVATVGRTTSSSHSHTFSLRDRMSVSKRHSSGMRVVHATLPSSLTPLPSLRDITSESETENRRRIADMEKDISTLDELQGQLPDFYFLCLADDSVAQHDEALFKLANAEVQVEELKVQLDDALGAEEMLVQLTERNLMLGEVIIFSWHRLSCTDFLCYIEN